MSNDNLPTQSHYRTAIEIACEGFSMSTDLRKHLETALWAEPRDAVAASGPSEVERLTMELQNQREIAQHWKMKAISPAAQMSGQGASMPLVRWTFDGGMTAQVAEDGQWVLFKDIDSRPHSGQAAQEQATGVPDGWKLVPIKPTVNMHNAAALAGLCGKPPTITMDGRIEWALADASAVYVAMIAEAPTPDRATKEKPDAS